MDIYMSTCTALHVHYYMYSITCTLLHVQQGQSICKERVSVGVLRKCSIVTKPLSHNHRQ